jgi:NADH dehydrogenase [ubiquinone] 1 alpha subcomplex assembly factor 7
MSLKTRIVELIAAQGPISVAQFMTIALHDPQEGYYATRDPFGVSHDGRKGGDFITAPEISQMFGEMLGLWLAQAWDEQGRPAHPLLVELGPGRGTLMADMLRALKAAPEFLKHVKVMMVEASPFLRAMQQETLKAHAGILWQDHFDPPPGRPVFLVANEFFDALPIRQYVKTARGWCERMVTARDGELAFALAPTPVPSAIIPESRMEAPEGGVYETAPGALALAEDIARLIAASGGAALLVDYGHDARMQQAGSFAETLQAVGEHAFAEVLAAPGAHDLSAHVDFVALEQAGRRGGASVHGPIGQGALLQALGIELRARNLATRNPASGSQIAAALQRLTSPEEMGTLFKALAFLPPSAANAPGFARAGVPHAAA